MSADFVGCGGICCRKFHTHCVNLPSAALQLINSAVGLCYKCKICDNLPLFGLISQLSSITKELSGLKKEISEMKCCSRSASDMQTDSPLTSESVITNASVASLPIIIDPDQKATEGNEKWSKVPRKKRTNKKRAQNKNKKPIIGNDTSAPNFVALPKKELHAAGFRVDTTENAVINYITQKLVVEKDQVACVKLVKSSSDLTKMRYINFKISLPEDILARALNPVNWPSGIRIKHFIPKNGVALPVVAKIKM